MRYLIASVVGAHRDAPKGGRFTNRPYINSYSWLCKSPAYKIVAVGSCW